jgi:hypothetical protein
MRRGKFSNTVQVSISETAWKRFRALVATDDGNPLSLKGSWRAFPWTHSTFEGTDLAAPLAYDEPYDENAPAAVLRSILTECGLQADHENQSEKLQK